MSWHPDLVIKDSTAATCVARRALSRTGGNVDILNDVIQATLALQKDTSECHRWLPVAVTGRLRTIESARIVQHHSPARSLRASLQAAGADSNAVRRQVLERNICTHHAHGCRADVQGMSTRQSLARGGVKYGPSCVRTTSSQTTDDEGNQYDVGINYDPSLDDKHGDYFDCDPIAMFGYAGSQTTNHAAIRHPHSPPAE